MTKTSKPDTEATEPTEPTEPTEATEAVVEDVAADDRRSRRRAAIVAQRPAE